MARTRAVGSVLVRSGFFSLAGTTKAACVGETTSSRAKKREEKLGKNQSMEWGRL